MRRVGAPDMCIGEMGDNWFEDLNNYSMHTQYYTII